MRTGLASLLCVCAVAATAIGCGEDSKRDDPGRAAEADPSASASAASQPAPDPGPSAAHLRQARRERRERAVEGAVRDFYREVGYGDYDAAWARLTEPAQASLGGYDAWRAGYEFSVSTRVSGVNAVDTTPAMR